MAPRKKHGNYGITLDTGEEIIEPVENEKMLGCLISSDFTWNEHIRDNELSMQRLLTSRINALKKVSGGVPFKTRKMLANSIVLSIMIKKSLSYTKQSSKDCHRTWLVHCSIRAP